MAHNSYFKISDNFFFFNDADMTDTVRAFNLALAAGTNVSVYRVPTVSGPWNKIGIVGYRMRGDILAELATTTDAERQLYLREELCHLDRAYVRAGQTEHLVAA